MKVYIDVVIMLNFLIDLILILSVAIVLRRKTNIKKLIMSSIIGSLSLCLLFLIKSNITLLLVKVISSIVMVVIAFNFRDIKYTLKNVLYLYISSSFLGGVLYMLNLELCYQNEGMIFYHNEMSLNYIILLLLLPLSYTYI